MGILSRMRERGEAYVAQRLQGQARALSFAIPGKGGPICEIRLEAEAEPQADGRRLRLRAHLHLWSHRLRRKVDSWVELRASSAALDEGSRALVPDKLAVLGIEAKPGKPLQTWAGALGGPRAGFALLSLLQFDKERLPARLRRALGARPLHLTATVASVVEDT